MKKIVSLMLVILLLFIFVITVNATSPVEPDEHARESFIKLYSETTNEQIPYNLTSIGIYDYKVGVTEPFYVFLKYTTPEPIEKPYFNRFGENDEYYEYSEVTNLLCSSGMMVFYGDAYYPLDYSDIFYNLGEIALIDTKVIDWVIDFVGPDYVGKIGDADKDRKISIMDATTILRHEAKLETMDVELIGDIDGDGELSVLDATEIQQRLVNIK